jgi:hypothetical protein
MTWAARRSIGLGGAGTFWATTTRTFSYRTHGTTVLGRLHIYARGNPAPNLRRPCWEASIFKDIEIHNGPLYPPLQAGTFECSFARQSDPAQLRPWVRIWIQTSQIVGEHVRRDNG